MKKLFIIFCLLVGLVVLLPGADLSADSSIVETGQVLHTSPLADGSDLYIVKLPLLPTSVVLTVPESEEFAAEEGQHVKILLSDEVSYQYDDKRIVHHYEVLGIEQLSDHGYWHACTAWGYAEGDKPRTLLHIGSHHPYGALIQVEVLPDERENFWAPNGVYVTQGFSKDQFLQFAEVGDMVLRVHSYGARSWYDDTYIKNTSHRIFNMTRGTVSKTFKGVWWD